MARLGIAPENLDPRRYVGPKLNVIPVTEANRRPSVLDRLYPLFTLWRVRSPVSGSGAQGELWYLARFVDSEVGFNPGDAIWIMLSGGSSGPLISVETDDGAPNVIPDGLGEIQIFGGTGISVTGQGPGKTVTVAALATIPLSFTTDAGIATPAANNLNVIGGSGITTSGVGDTITIALSGGGAAIDSVDVDFATVPGVDPVTPDAAGLIAILGNVVTNGTNANSPVATHTRAVNQFHIDVQLATAIGVPADPFDVGLASFNQDHFTVDGNGWVSLAGGGLAIDQINVDANTPPGTDPVVASATGEITVTGGQVASGVIGANVIQTNSLAANTYTIQIQQTDTAGSKDTTLNGVAHFDSTFFTDDEGFISLVTPVPGGGSWVFISEATASASATVDFTSGIDSTYDIYLFTLTNMAVSLDTNIELYVSSDGGMNFDNGITDYWTQETTVLSELGESSFISLTPVANVEADDDVFSSLVYMMEPSNSNKRTFFQLNSVWFDGTIGRAVSSGGFRNANSAVDAIRFRTGSGVFSTGTFRLYGLKTS